jgi:hypothetical protein
MLQVELPHPDATTSPKASDGPDGPDVHRTLK